MELSARQVGTDTTFSVRPSLALRPTPLALFSGLSSFAGLFSAFAPGNATSGFCLVCLITRLNSSAAVVGKAGLPVGNGEAEGTPYVPVS